MLKAIIFDMDGVLIDSTKYVWEANRILLEKEGVKFSEQDIKKWLGMSLRDQLKIWSKYFGIRELDLNDYSRKSFDIQMKLMREKEKPNKDLINLIKNAKEDSVKLAVATSSSKYRAEKILDMLGITNFFDVIIAADDVPNHKPNPDLFLEAARRINVKPEECAVIEDAENGVEAAKRGNIKVVALLTPYHTKEELKEADLIINDFSELSIGKLKNLINTK
jgi:HAD superfamily hydrolase (TIGR01509 family)